MGDTMKIMRKGGPDKCARQCSECVGADHHFSEAMLEDENTTEVENHEAITQGVEVWYECKHCDAWLEYDLDGELSDDEPDADDEPDHEDDSSGADCGTPRQLPLGGGAW